MLMKCLVRCIVAVCLQDRHHCLKEDVALTYEYVTGKGILVNFYMVDMNLLIGNYAVGTFFCDIKFSLLSFIFLTL